MARRAAGLALAFGAALAIASPAGAAEASGWVGSWASAQMVPAPQDALAPADLAGATLRQIVHLSLGGRRVRIRLSNAFGTAPLELFAVSVARAVAPGSAAVEPGTRRAVTFDGRAEVVVPAGADYLSDPVELEVAPLSSLSVDLRFAAPPPRQTGHPGARTTSWLIRGEGEGGAGEVKSVERWFQLSGVEVEAEAPAAGIVALGDSITDGHATTTNGDDRWTDDLARRLQGSAPTREVAVLNEGIGGNRLLLDGLGPNALSRFDRDVLSQAGARWVIVLEGINDLGMLTHAGPVSPAAHSAEVAGLIEAYRQIVSRAHAHGLKVIGGTLTPFVGSDFYHPDAANEADRQAVNAWIRGPGHFDAVVDFDAALRDPARPDRLAPAYDSGDHLHPSPEGYRVMAAAIPLQLFER